MKPFLSTAKMVLACWLAAGTLILAVPGADAADTPPATPFGAEAEHVLAAGFDAIHDYSLKPPPMDEMALEGVRGLTAIDPEISIATVPKRRFKVRYRDQNVGSYPLPASEDDGPAWARVVATISRDIAARSTDVAHTLPERFYEAVFDATLAQLDIFSHYAGAQEATEHRAARDGFGGVGIRYETADEGIVITEVMTDSPAARAGLKVGERIAAIDGTPVATLDAKGITALLRGPLGSAVRLSLHGREVVLHRALIVPSTVSVAFRNGIAVIGIASFNQGTAETVEQNLRHLRATGTLKGVVLDLRGNPGGLFDQGVGVAALFMDHGRVVSTKGRHPASLQSYDVVGAGLGDELPVAVLIDGSTASAAEIVASALQDSGKAVVIGTNSFGKGTVQTIVELPNTGEMTLTWSRYFSPSGYALHGLGVLPVLCTARESDPAKVIAQLTDPRRPLPGQFARWRAVGSDEGGRRHALRGLCPRATHNGTVTDLAVAKRVLSDPALYRRAVTLSAPTGGTQAAAAERR